MHKVETVDAYIAEYPENVRPILESVRVAIHDAAPDAEESIHYSMPAWRLDGHPIAYFAAYKHHLGFFATPVGFGPFDTNLAAFERGKGSVKFPYAQPLPLQLIAGIVKWRYEMTGTNGS